MEALKDFYKKKSINYCIDISELIIVVIGCRSHDLECLLSSGSI